MTNFLQFPVTFKEDGENFTEDRLINLDHILEVKPARDDSLTILQLNKGYVMVTLTYAETILHIASKTSRP